MRFFKKCETCKKKRFITAQRKIFVPQMHTEVTSKNHICGKCYKGVLSMLKSNHG